jgi:hypothetical protein
MNNDAFSSYDSPGNLLAAGPGGGSLYATNDERVFAALQLYYGAAGGADVEYDLYFEDLAVYGNHGLTIQGGAPNGFYPSQIATWALQQAQGLQPGIIPETDATGYVIPHSVYYTPVNLNQIVDDMATAAGWHWGIWESLSPLTGPTTPRLDFRPRPQQGSYTASCVRGDCETCDIREALSGMYNKAIITYTNVDGNDRAVTVTADNPVLDIADINRTVVLNGGTMTSASAEVFGAMALDLLYQQTTLEAGQGGNLVETLQSRLTAAATLAAQGGA